MQHSPTAALHVVVAEVLGSAITLSRVADSR